MSVIMYFDRVASREVVRKKEGERKRESAARASWWAAEIKKNSSRGKKKAVECKMNKRMEASFLRVRRKQRGGGGYAEQE